MSTGSRDHAVVLGGGMAGLLAALVLAKEYARVTVVERDLLPGGETAGTPRRGVPQGPHSHGMLPRGLQIIEDLLPGVTDEFVRRGALTGDALADTRWHLHAGTLCQTHTGLSMLSASRALIEGTVRDRVRALHNVSILDGYDIVGLGVSPDDTQGQGNRAHSARVTSLHGQGSRVLPADLVVDATGRGSRTPRWLADLGFEAPEEDRVTVDLRYASRVFRADPGTLDAWLGTDIAVLTSRHPGRLRSGIVQRIEGGLVLVTLAGMLGQRPPLDLAGFVEYARTLPRPDTYEVIRTAEPVGDAAAFRVPDYTRPRYERLAAFPAGLLVTGDAACSFNPVYGQGMSIAAMAALTLRDELRHGGEPVPGRYFAALARTLDVPWFVAVGADLAIPGVTGPALAPSPLGGGYLPALQAAAVTDPVLSNAFIRVTALVDPPTALVRPEIAERVERARSAAAGSDSLHRDQG